MQIRGDYMTATQHLLNYVTHSTYKTVLYGNTKRYPNKKMGNHVLDNHDESFMRFKCTILWDFILLLALKRLSQRSQANGFSPVCMRTCRVRWAADGHTFPQKQHRCSVTWNMIKMCYCVNIFSFYCTQNIYTHYVYRWSILNLQFRSFFVLIFLQIHKIYRSSDFSSNLTRWSTDSQIST